MHRRMADVFSSAKRSEIMSRIRSRGNASTELRVVRTLRQASVTGWRRHPAGVPGSPDFVFPAARTVARTMPLRHSARTSTAVIPDALAASLSVSKRSSTRSG